MTRTLNRGAARRAAAAGHKTKSPYTSREFRVTANARQNLLIDRLRRRYTDTGIALYLGAGVSASVGFPTWSQLIRSLLSGVLERKALPGSWLDYERTKSWPWRPETIDKAVRAAEFETARPLILMARVLRNHLGHQLPWRVAGALYSQSVIGEWLVDDAWVRQLQRGKATLDPDLMSSALINAIVDLSLPRIGSEGVKAMVNYNFDDLVDEMIRQGGIPCSTIGSPSDRAAPNALPCYHVHGVLPLRAYAKSLRTPLNWKRPRGDFVFSEEEYHRQYAEPFRWSNLVQTSLLGAYDGLFVGLSMEDPNIRRLLDATHRQYPRRRNYAILKRHRPLHHAGRSVKDIVTNLFEDIEANSFIDIGINVIWVDDFKEIPAILKVIAESPVSSERQ